MPTTTENRKRRQIQDFEIDAKAKFNDEKVEGFINEHSQHNMKIFKKVIEADENVYN